MKISSNILGSYICMVLLLITITWVITTIVVQSRERHRFETEAVDKGFADWHTEHNQQGKPYQKWSWKESRKYPEWWDDHSSEEIAEVLVAPHLAIEALTIQRIMEAFEWRSEAIDKKYNPVPKSYNHVGSP